MPLLDFDRHAFQASRERLAQQQAERRRASAEHARASSDLHDLQHKGSDPRLVARAQRRVDAAAEQTRSLTKSSNTLLGSMRDLSDELLGRRDPQLLVESLDTRHPVMLMPVAVQTRYASDLSQLMIRIYPDALHAVTHNPGLLPEEIASAKQYWSQRHADANDAQTPWDALARRYGPTRAAYLVAQVVPTNAAPDAPTFDDAAIPQAAPHGQQAYATALPDRFVVVGTLNGQEVLRKWGGAVLDQVALAPPLDPLLVDVPEDFKPFGDDRAWMVDYGAALKAGLAITVTQQDLKGNATMLQGFDRLVVLGVDWTHDAQSAATLVAQLFDQHQHGDGLKFLAHGTPTNNTSRERAGFAANGADVSAALQPEVSAARSTAVADELDAAGARAQLLLGLPRAAFDAGSVPGADASDGQTAAHMINALWNATLGYTLRYFWNPTDNSAALLSDAAIDELRAWAVRFVRPGGPLAALRVGSQPYGLLPVMPKRYTIEANATLEQNLFKVIDWFRWQYEMDDKPAKLPSLQDPSAESLHQVLSLNPWSVAKRFRHVTGRTVNSNDPVVKEMADAQTSLLGLIANALLGRFRNPLNPQPDPYLAECLLRAPDHSLDIVPWVQREPEDDAALKRNYIAELQALLQQPHADDALRRALRPLQNGETLLEALLAFAADEEFLRSAWSLFHDHVSILPGLSDKVKSEFAHWRPAEYPGVDTQALRGDQVELGSVRAVLGMALAPQVRGPAIHTNGLSLDRFITSHFDKSVLLWPERLKNIATLRDDSLEHLKTRSSAELSLALRGTLDLCSYRLDAWITSLATRRLDRMREADATGLHIGAWGVVEGLRPDAAQHGSQARDSLGYVHAPSLQQAATAAILRSAHLANRETAGNAFDIDLRSRRVKRARRLLEGVGNGQSLAALLGYRFERAMRDVAGLPNLILDYRRAFPLRPAGDDASAEAKEDIAARDVIDGVRLVDEFRQRGAQLLPAAVASVADQNRVAPLITDLADQLDAVGDLLTAESVFQLAGGNMDGAGAAMLTVDRQQRPPDTRVVDTPHSTRGYTQRVVVAMASDSVAGEWDELDDLASQVEPRLNDWLGLLLGDPARWRFRARVLDAVFGDAEAPSKITAWVASAHPGYEVGLDALGLSPLSLVLGSEAERSGGRSRVQQRIGAAFEAMARAEFGADGAAQKAIVLEPGSDDANGLVAFESFAWLLRRLLDKARPLRRMDLVRLERNLDAQTAFDDGDAAGVDLVELRGRVKLADDRADAVVQQLADALAPLPADPFEIEDLDPSAPATQALYPALQSALAAADALGWRSANAIEAAAETGGLDPQGQASGGERAVPLDSVAAAAARARALHDEARRAAAPMPLATEPPARQLDALVARVRSVMGKSFTILPEFSLGAYASSASASLAERTTLLDNDELAMAGWLPKLGCVREATGLLADVICAAEAQGFASRPDDFKLLQFPHDATHGSRWAALPPLPKQDLRGTVAVVAHAPGALTHGLGAGDTLAGLFIDEWSESIPNDVETTALSFHFDAPGARAPQSVLLAVPPDRGVPNWTLDTLLETVEEALALSRLRGLSPKTLHESGLGLVLPGLFLSNNFKHDVPSINWGDLITKGLTVARANAGLTSTRIAATLAEGKTTLSR